MRDFRGIAIGFVFHFSHGSFGLPPLGGGFGRDGLLASPAPLLPLYTRRWAVAADAGRKCFGMRGKIVAGGCDRGAFEPTSIQSTSVQPAKGSTIGTPAFAKSARFRVTTGSLSGDFAGHPSTQSRWGRRSPCAGRRAANRRHRRLSERPAGRGDNFPDRHAPLQTPAQARHGPCAGTRPEVRFGLWRRPWSS